MDMEKPNKSCSRHPDENIVFVKNPENDHHYGRWSCSNPDCNKFVSWAKRPATTAALQQRQDAILKIVVHLAQNPTDDKLKMIKFMMSIYNTIHLNLVQLSTYDKITGITPHGSTTLPR